MARKGPAVRIPLPPPINEPGPLDMESIRRLATKFDEAPATLHVDDRGLEVTNIAGTESNQHAGAQRAVRHEPGARSDTARTTDSRWDNGQQRRLTLAEAVTAPTR
jgi:hypothetical protein